MQSPVSVASRKSLPAVYYILLFTHTFCSHMQLSMSVQRELTIASSCAQIPVMPLSALVAVGTHSIRIRPLAQVIFIILVCHV